MDALLLWDTASQIVAQRGDKPWQSASVLPHPSISDDSIEIFTSLLPGPHENITIPTFLGRVAPQELLQYVYSRFGNNNFTIHSHLNTYAHGVFPISSRYFNHACAPNAVPRYIIRPGEPVLMEVVAIQPIRAGEEVCIPYLDPALPLATREQRLDLRYGFRCSCTLCTNTRALGIPPAPPTDPPTQFPIFKALRDFVFNTLQMTATPRTPKTSTSSQRRSSHHKLNFPHSDSNLLTELPHELRCILHKSFLPHLSEMFADLGHQSVPRSLEVGETLLALYLVLYPRYFPQIGLHLLEMAKVAWNVLIVSTSDSNPEHTDTQLYLDTVGDYLDMAAEALSVLGNEGDDGGPSAELEVLTKLRAEEEARTRRVS